MRRSLESSSAERAATHALEALQIAEIALRSPHTRAVIALDPERSRLLRETMAALLAHVNHIPEEP